jgi:2-amino-4-hydroxy-6-hydroxymethyldihydropteridine diphosphokinase
LDSPGLVLNEPDLTLPHPELLRRAFALGPLLDVAPGAREPRSGRRYADLALPLEAHGVRRLESGSSWDPRPSG